MTKEKISFHVNDQIDGFLVKSITELNDMDLVAIQLEHQKSGARILHLYNDDAENLFSINFATPPQDDTGVPHIIEHSVLSGSKKFPVKEPFFEMVKMSMATFINAMTGWDCTYYPVASNVKQDLFNLAEVYFDAVFHPLLTEQTFKREAHHLVPVNEQDPTGELTINGVVYNEMKGGFSDPEARLYREMSRSLFPDSIYGKESGGDPEAIPELSYEDFMHFYKQYYHPGNAFIFLYGNIKTEEYLDFLRDKLDAFERRTIDLPIKPQPKWNQPKKRTDYYPIGKEEPIEEKTYLTISWLVGDGINAADVAQMHILSNILLGNEAAPLKKAIIDSKLGKDLIYSGFRSVGLQTVFRVGLKGSEPNRADQFEKLVFDTLSEIAAAEPDREQIEAAFQQAAYHYREILPSYPLHLLDRVMDAWLYGADPLTFVRMNEYLDECKRRYEADPGLFNRLIRERLLNNPHRLTFVFQPDRSWQEKKQAEFKERMQKIRRQFNEEQLKKIAAEASELERISGTPNPPEALASLPQLQVSDLPRRPRHIPTTVEKLPGGVDFLINDVFSNGVNYLFVDFNLKGLPRPLWQFLARYADAIQKLGAAGMSYEEIARRIAAYTGGIGCWCYFTTHVNDPNLPMCGLRFSLKTLDEQIEPALDVLHDLIFAVDPRDRDRLQYLVSQANARYRTELVHDGSTTASRHACRGFSAPGHLDELVHGLPQLTLTDRFEKNFDRLHPELMDSIEAIRNFILNPARLTVSFTGSDRSTRVVKQHIREWIEKMNHKPADTTPVDFEPYEQPPREGLAGPMEVAFCAKIIPAPHISHPDAMLVKLGTRIISLEYILNEIRFKGNAYGAWCNYNELSGNIELGSYHDPHIVRTLGIFSDALAYVQKADWTQNDINRAIIGTAKNYEKPIRPKSATKQALHQHIVGQTPELRERQFETILSATKDQVKRATLEVLEANLSRSAVCVVSSRQKLEAANREMKNQPLVIEDIL